MAVKFVKKYPRRRVVLDRYALTMGLKLWVVVHFTGDYSRGRIIKKTPDYWSAMNVANTFYQGDKKE